MVLGLVDGLVVGVADLADLAAVVFGAFAVVLFVAAAPDEPAVVAVVAVAPDAFAAVAGSIALMAMPVLSAVATPMLSDAAIARPRGAAWGRRRR